MQLQFEGSLSPEIYLRALKLHGGLQRTVRVIALVVVPVMLYGVILEPIRTGREVTGVVPLVIWTIIALVLWLGPGWNVRRVLKTNKILSAPVTGSATDTGVRLATSFSETELPWDVFLKSKTSDRVVLLYQSANQFNVIPQEWFADAQAWEAFRRLAQRRTRHEKTHLLSWPLRLLLVWIAILLLVFVVYNLMKPSRDAEPNREGASPAESQGV